MSHATANPTLKPLVRDESARHARLEANLAALGSRNADFAERLRATQPSCEVAFAQSRQEVPAATLAGAPLCSRHRPLDEARKLTDGIDIMEHATFVINGFGLGYHARTLAERIGRTGVLIVLEPDVALLRSVFEHVDHSGWMTDALIVFMTDPSDRAMLARLLDGAESTIALGVEFVEHPPSRKRLGSAAAEFASLFSQFVETARTTLVTTLIRSVDTTRNLLLNMDHYVGGSGIADLAQVCKDAAAVIVSAGPSMHRQLAALQQPGVRDRCVIIAVQTTLKPLLDAGIRPHFVTALDYHEISQRFYEGLDHQMLSDVTLVAEPKAHPVILDVYPGPVRCCSSGFLDRILGPMKREMGALPAGATVAHLALYLADFLGCQSIALIGQDLGFSDGLYYTPGTAIHDVWAPELNPFNTIAMMEWQRIVRHRTHLRTLKDIHDRPIYTDAQMLTYLRQFERDFSEMEARGLLVVDAGGAGVAKQHTAVQDLKSFIDQYATKPLPEIPIPPQNSDQQRVQKAMHRISAVKRDIETLRVASRRTAHLIDCMLQDQNDPRRMKQHFTEMDRQRRLVDEHFEAFGLVNTINQLGAYKRMRADRKMQLATDVSPLERQRLELQRDRENVRWIGDASQEMMEQLDDCLRLLRGEQIDPRGTQACQLVKRAQSDSADAATPAAVSNIAAFIPVDPRVFDPGEASVAVDLRLTIGRLLESCEIAEVVVLCSDVHASVINGLVDSRRVIVKACGDSPFQPEHEAIRKARLFSTTSWRGGIGGLTCYDELFCPQAMLAVMEERRITAAVLVGPDWPAVQVTGEVGCDAILARHREFPERHRLVFTQAIPGLCGCLISRELCAELADRNRLSTLGAMLVYQPTRPQHDPIARDANVQLPPALCRPVMRITTGNTRDRMRWQHMKNLHHSPLKSPSQLISAYAAHLADTPDPLPQQIILEITPRRESCGIFARHPYTHLARQDITLELVEKLMTDLEQSGCDMRDIAFTLDGLGDPMLHPQIEPLVHTIVSRGAAAVHLRTELLIDRATIDSVIAAGVDVISIDLHADRAATYCRMMGVDRFREVLENIEHIVRTRRCLTKTAGTAGIGLPWIVPRMQRRAETFEDIDTFFDRWQHTLGAVVLESPTEYIASGEGGLPLPADDLIPAPTPRQVIDSQLRRRMLILSDGSVPLDERDMGGASPVGCVGQQPIQSLWHDLQLRRRAAMNQLGMFRP